MISFKMGIYSGNVGVDNINSIVPDGIEVLKKKNGKYVSYKKVKYKKFKKGFTFVDNQVKAGKQYSYKFRLYKKINGKMVYSSSKNTKVKLYALNNMPSCTIGEISGDSQEMIISLTNNEKYGNIKYPTLCELDFVDYDKYSECEQDVVAYSFDKSTWLTNYYDCQIKPGETIYLKIREESKNTYSLNDILAVNIFGSFGNNSIGIDYNLVDKTTDVWCED